jgi:hypothetical protein
MPTFCCARQDFRNSGQVRPFVVPAALAARHSAPHCFMTLCALAGPEIATASPKATSAAQTIWTTELRICFSGRRLQGRPSRKGVNALKPAESGKRYDLWDTDGAAPRKPAGIHGGGGLFLLVVASAA